MPATDIDWSGIRAAAISLQSVNAAAVQAGADLPPPEASRLRERINKRALRERWMEQSRALLAATVPTNALPLSMPVQTGSQIVVNSEAGKKARIFRNLARWGVNASQSAAKSRSPLSDAPNVKHVASVFATLWPDKQQAGVSIQMLSVGGGMG